MKSCLLGLIVIVFVIGFLDWQVVAHGAAIQAGLLDQFDSVENMKAAYV